MSKEKLGWYDSDCLIVKTNGNRLSLEELEEKLLPYMGKWNSDKDCYIFNGILDLNNWEDEFIYPKKGSIQIIQTPVDKLRYLYACMHNDDKIFEFIKNLIPNLKEVEITNNRTTKKNYIKLWQEIYPFTLEEFLLNDRFMIISEIGGYTLDTIINLGLIKWDNIEYCSEYDIGDEENEAN